jgi:hypothetical protein
VLHGVDVSDYQPDWVPAADGSFVFVKATEGTGYRSNHAAAQLAAARAKRVQIGHYHDIRPDNAAKQAAYFVANADIRPGDLLVCDWELIRSGIVGYPRGFIADSFQNNKHGHFVSVELYRHAHLQMQAQINEYKRGGDSLVGNRPYTGPKVPLGRWKDSHITQPTSRQ